jgi:hypothetical protein
MAIIQSEEHARDISSSASKSHSTGKDASDHTIKEESASVIAADKEPNALEVDENLGQYHSPTKLAQETAKLLKESINHAPAEQKKESGSPVKIQGIFALADDIAKELKGLPKEGEAPDATDKDRLEIAKNEQEAETKLSKESDMGRDPTKH